jgi:hypothetical protein
VVVVAVQLVLADQRLQELQVDLRCQDELVVQATQVRQD